MLKKLVTLSALLLLTLQGFSQDCSFDEEKKDPFSGEVVRKVEHRIGPTTWNWRITVIQEGTTRKMNLQIVLGGHVDDIIEKGNKLMLKLEDGTILSLPADEDNTPGHVVSQGVIWSSYQVKYTLDEESLTKLGKSPITDLKVKIGPRELLLPKITSKQSERIQTSFRCVL